MAAALRGLLLTTLLLAGFGLKGILIEPPAATSTAFDTDRAAARLQRILGDQRAHPVDSSADDAVRSRLVAELRAIGLSPEVHETTDCSAMPKTRFVSCSHVRNVIATIPSVHAGRNLLLNAHYDSTPTGPGAGDDGLGVAVLLEVGAILKESPPPRPVTLLFNEGEEFGLNGAHAFVRTDPIARHVNSLINIDARGVSGPALMYETSDPNEAAVKVYASATRRPYANSISTDFAKLIPNTTDVVFFKPQGWTVLNYGIIGNETRYHSPADTVAALDHDSMGHVGSEVLAATRAMAALSSPVTAGSGRAVFTDIAGHFFIRLPLAFAAILLALLVSAAILICRRDKALGRPLAVVAGSMFTAMLVSAFAGFALALLRPGDFWRAYPLFAYLPLYAVLLLAMAAFQARFSQNIDRRRMRAAAWLLILLLGAALSFALPGATIFFLIAPALAVTGLAFTNRAPRVATILSSAAVIVQFLMLAELLAFIELLFVDGPLWAVAPLAAVAALPAMIEVDPRAFRPAVLALALCSFGFSAAALIMPRASSDRPLGFSIDYFRDVPSNRANWGIATKQAPLPTNYPGTWDSGVLPYNGRTRWIEPAPLLQTPTPSARVLGNEPYGVGRRVRLILSPGGGNTVSLRFSKAAKVLALGLWGTPVRIPEKGEPEKPLLRCTGRSCEGLKVEIVLGDRRPVNAELFSTQFGLPREGASLAAARPKDAIPQYAPDQTITRIVVRL